jgi:hypothetical protein
VPIANVYVHTRESGGAPLVLIDKLGISTPVIDYIVVAVLILVCFFILGRWAKKRDIPGHPMVSCLSQAPNRGRFAQQLADVSRPLGKPVPHHVPHFSRWR